MNSFESLGNNSQENSYREKNFKMRENIFDSLIAEKLLDISREGMDDAEYEESDIRDVEGALAALSSEDLKCFLSVPFEIRENFYRSLRETVLLGEKSFRVVIAERISKMKEKGYTLGYHVSKFEIAPQVIDDKKEWNVAGYERDERDEFDERDARFMAYYSLDYKNFYRKKGGNYIYIVRAQTGKDTSHKQDLSNNWGRAPMLSVVGRLNISEVDMEVDRILREKNPEG